MPIVKVGGAQIEYETRGNGDIELLLIPGGVLSEAFKPLVAELILDSNLFRITTLHRRGYGGSSSATPPFSIEDQARDCLAVMDNSNLKRTHIVGHSLSGLMALQFASEVPNRIANLILIEPALIAFTQSASQSAEAL